MTHGIGDFDAVVHLNKKYRIPFVYAMAVSPRPLGSMSLKLRRNLGGGGQERFDVKNHEALARGCTDILLDLPICAGY